MLYLNDAHVAGLLDPAGARTVVLEALAELADGAAATTTPPGILARRAEVTYHAKGAYLTGRGIAGFRLAGFPKGPAPAARLQMLVLTEYASSTPLAMIQSESLHPLRVGAAIAVAVERLRASGARTLVMLGAGRLARASVEAIQATAPFTTVRVAASSLASARRFCESTAAAGLVPAEDAASAARDADVIVTLTNVDAPLVQPEWCRPGSLLVTAGARQECAERAILQADRIFVDDWAQCSAIGDIGVLVKNGRIGAGDVESLAAVCAGRIAGRASDSTRLVAVPQGLAVLDLAIGQRVFELARERGIGVTLPL